MSFKSLPPIYAKWPILIAFILLISACGSVAGNSPTLSVQSCEFGIPNAETTAMFSNDPSCSKTLSDLAYITNAYWIPVNSIPASNSLVCQVTNAERMAVTVWDSGGWTYSNELCDFLEMDGFSPT